MSGNWQRRWHPLLQQWVLIAAKSALRPWSGEKVKSDTAPGAPHDPDCYLCAGVTRASGNVNPHYTGAWAFDNDYASLSPDAPPTDNAAQTPLRQAAAATGRCRVLVWSERHNTTLAELSANEMHDVVKLWKKEYDNLSTDPSIAQVLIFENKGVEVGVSNLHPHGQIYASGFLTDTALRMRLAQAEYAAQNAGDSLMQTLLQRQEYSETAAGELLIEAGEYFKTIVPYAARFSFETWIVPTRHVSSIAKLNHEELTELAVMYQRQAQRYDRLFERKSPNITLLQNAPCDDNAANHHWCFHIIQQPPLRDATTLKYLAGFEMGSNTIVNPVQPEDAAARLRECS